MAPFIAAVRAGEFARFNVLVLVGHFVQGIGHAIGESLPSWLN
jgi:hypothetical protein